MMRLSDYCFLIVVNNKTTSPQKTATARPVLTKLVKDDLSSKSVVIWESLPKSVVFV